MWADGLFSVTQYSIELPRTNLLTLRQIPIEALQPPLLSIFGDHWIFFTIIWAVSCTAIYLYNVYSAFVNAMRINQGKLLITHDLETQLSHVVFSYLLAFLFPGFGLFMSPPVITEIFDSIQEKRWPSKKVFALEAFKGAIEWLLLLTVYYVCFAITALWSVWWIVRVLAFVWWGSWRR